MRKFEFDQKIFFWYSWYNHCLIWKSFVRSLDCLYLCLTCLFIGLFGCWFIRSITFFVHLFILCWFACFVCPSISSLICTLCFFICFFVDSYDLFVHSFVCWFVCFVCLFVPSFHYVCFVYPFSSLVCMHCFFIHSFIGLYALLVYSFFRWLECLFIHLFLRFSVHLFLVCMLCLFICPSFFCWFVREKS